MDPDRIEYLQSQKGKMSIDDLIAAGYVNLANYVLAGYQAKDLKTAGLNLDKATYEAVGIVGRRKDLISVGFDQVDFSNIQVDAALLKADGVTCEMLLKAGWNVAVLKQVYDDATVKSTLRKIRETQSIHLWKLKLAGFTIAEMKEAGYLAPALKSDGAWDSDIEKEDVDAVYGDEEIWRQMELLKKTKSVPVSMELLKDARDSYLAVVKRLLKNRDNRRSLENQSKQLQSRIDKATKWIDKLRAQAQLEEEKKRIDELREQRKVDDEELKKKRKIFVDTVDGRIKHIKTVIKYEEKKTKAIRTLIDDRIRGLNNAYGDISITNHKLIKRSYPLTDRSPEERMKLIQEVEDQLGVPETVILSTIKHPYEEMEEVEGSDAQQWSPDDEAPHVTKPLQYLRYMEAKKEKVEWMIDDLKAEIELLENLKEVAKNEKALWRPVASKAVYHTLLGLARYTTTEVGMPSPLRIIKGDLSPVKWRRITGKIDFNLEIGASVGVGSSTVATASVGLNIALSGSLAVEDDRRVRARISLKLIPNVEVKVHPGGCLSVAKATASFGFTITSQAMAFVDEKHFAHYMMFRIANIRNFHDKLMEYGARGLDSEYDPFSDEVQKISSEGLNKKSVEKYYKQQRTYLTKMPVVKAHMPLKGKIRPTVDLGAESSVVGVSGGISAQMKTPMYFQKEILGLPDTSAESSPKERMSHRGTEYWEYAAADDADCVYESIAFLMRYHGVRFGLRGNLPTTQDLRNLAARFIENIHNLNQAGDDPVWAVDTSLYGGVDDYVDWIRTGRQDNSGKKRHYADLPVVAALAQGLRCSIHIHQKDQDVIALPPNPRPKAEVLHLAFRGKDQFNALIIKLGEHLPVDQGQIPAKMSDAAHRPVNFDEFGEINYGLKETLWRLDTRKRRSSREILTRKKELQRKYTPRMIVLGRMGDSMSLGGNVNFESWVNIGLEGTLSRINHHINPDNDGDYLNIKTKANLLQRTFAAEPTGDPEVGDPMGRDALGDVWKNSKPPDNLGLDKLGNALGPVELSIDFLNRFVEWNYIWESGCYRKQYRRYSYTSGMSVKVAGDVDVYPGFVAGLSFSFGFSKTVTMSENIGTNTLSYLLTVFNGLKLRPNGLKQWDAYLKKHGPSLRLLYLRIGVAVDKDPGDAKVVKELARKGRLRRRKKDKLQKKTDKKLDNAYKDAVKFESLVKDNKPIWEKHEDKPWCRRKNDETDASNFVNICKSNLSKLEASRRKRMAGHLRAKYNPLPDCMDELNDRFTTLLWRASRVISTYDERMNPFTRKIRYLIPAKGTICFNTRLGDGGMQLIDAPIIRVPRKKSKAQWVKYKSVADIWLNPNLRWAENALAFYREGFAIELVLNLPSSKRKLLLHPVGTATSDNPNDKDNNEMIRQFFMDLAKDSVEKRKGNLEDFQALVKMDSTLAKIFNQWIIHLGSDVIKGRRRLPSKLKRHKKPKDNYPEHVDGMHLIPKNHQQINMAAAPEIVSRYGGEREEKQQGLSDREKWVTKANYLWDEWVAAKEEELQAETGGAVDSLEVLLTKIKGPFPGYSDDNDWYLTAMEQQLP